MRGASNSTIRTALPKTNLNHSYGDYTLIGTDLTGLWLQPGFVEGIISDKKRFETLSSAYRHIFRRNLEYAILLWNGLPIRFSYQDDLPNMVNSLITMLWTVQNTKTLSKTSYQFQTPNLQSVWQVETSSDIVTIEANWQNIAGCYEVALNQMGLISMTQSTFLCEWKLLLQQFIQAMDESKAILTQSKARKQLQTLRTLEANIPSQGRFYQY